ncbi:Uncharacterised protein [Shigella sonnei]|nr:Uncharacterised protein [Shigella sonnei]CSE37170.1 Uncharacterised protein [Shigella sonnei]CSE73069.1 Uncharacterised protein [Shigella sonnei]CSE77705.1 Uncharacterised protein [Shigella sonnei]CSE83467.1 Uncharacterised protein [Shigella sonnei]
MQHVFIVTLNAQLTDIMRCRIVGQFAVIIQAFDVFIVDFRHIADDVGQRRTVRIVTTFIAFNFDTRKTVLIDGKASYLYFGQVSFHRNRGETV